ncbi:hypothetical protein IV203_034941 [Nitzschia inconspicua]|uniref:Uncharacterized protein n=1 Tax=Nitzschia inconspicua TaxID=303405 RepID=A0A9K3LD44_9STRA|nr:hypothetical protein IV203_034941 [Nitzschia inconspicua]
MDVELAKKETQDAVTQVKRTSLEAAQVELERQGLSCNLVSERLLVGVSSVCRWDVEAKMEVIAFVQRVPGMLTHEKILQDLKSLPSWVEQHKVGDKCPPFGFGRCRLKLLVYYADYVAQEAAYEITRTARPREWCGSTFLAAQDAEGKSYILDRGSAPVWGRAFYPELRYRAERLTGGSINALQPPGFPWWIKIFGLVTYLYIFFMAFQIPWILLVFFGTLLLHFLIAALCQSWHDRKQKRKNDADDYLIGHGAYYSDDGDDSHFHVV